MTRQPKAHMQVKTARRNLTNRLRAMRLNSVMFFLFEFCNGHVHLRVKGECGWLEDRRGRLVLSVDNMKTSLSGREPLNGAAEPGRNLLEIDVFDVTESVRTKNRCNARRLETAGPTFTHFLKLFGPDRY